MGGSNTTALLTLAAGVPGGCARAAGNR